MDYNQERSDFHDEMPLYLLHYLRYERKGATPSFAEIAADMGWTEDHVRKIVREDRSLRLEDFTRFYRFSGKPIKVLRYLIHECDPRLSVIELDPGPVNGSMSDELENLDIQKAEFIKSKRTALRDGKLDREERSILRDTVVDMLAILTTLIAEIDEFGCGNV